MRKAIVATARAEANAATGWLMSCVGHLKRREERTDGKTALSDEAIHEALDEARTAINRLEEICRA